MCSVFYIQVSTNGLVSFQAPFSSFHTSSFPTTSVPVIAPLWADFDFRETGNVFYRVTTDEATLDRVRTMIANSNPNLGGFSPTLCAIVTWSEATLFSRRLSRISVMDLKSNGAVAIPQHSRAPLSSIYALITITWMRPGVYC